MLTGHRKPKVNLFCQSIKPGVFRTKINFQNEIIDCFRDFWFILISQFKPQKLS